MDRQRLFDMAHASGLAKYASRVAAYIDKRVRRRDPEEGYGTSEDVANAVEYFSQR